jgi:hypothetical protein
LLLFVVLVLTKETSNPEKSKPVGQVATAAQLWQSRALLSHSAYNQHLPDTAIFQETALGLVSAHFDKTMSHVAMICIRLF